jgi:hypothetical protein
MLGAGYEEKPEKAAAARQLAAEKMWGTLRVAWCGLLLLLLLLLRLGGTDTASLEL